MSNFKEVFQNKSEFLGSIDDTKIMGENGTLLTIRVDHDMDIFLIGSETSIIADFPSTINGGGKHPKVRQALSLFKYPDKIPDLEKLLPIEGVTLDDSSGNLLKIAVSKDHNVQIVIRGKDYHEKKDQTVEFILSPKDKMSSPRLVAKFINLAKAIKTEDRWGY